MVCRNEDELNSSIGLDLQWQLPFLLGHRLDMSDYHLRVHLDSPAHVRASAQQLGRPGAGAQAGDVDHRALRARGDYPNRLRWVLGGLAAASAL
jgi:hypothetical protein